MIFQKGELFDTKASAIVHSVNTAGKSLTFAFKQAFPQTSEAYLKACKDKTLDIGKLLVVQENGKWIINFPTKRDVKRLTRLEDVEEGLRDLARIIAHHQIQSIALPALGCGEEGLNWTDVLPLMEQYLGELEEQGVDVLLYM